MATKRRKKKVTRKRKVARKRKVTRKRKTARRKPARKRKTTRKKKVTRKRKPARKRKTTRKKKVTRKKKPARKKKVAKKKSGKKRKPNPAFMKTLSASANLSAVVGVPKISRPQAMKKIWQYIHKHGLQDAKDRRKINLDANLKKLFGGRSSITMFELAKGVSKNLK